jgi:hypothetical protein
MREAVSVQPFLASGRASPDDFEHRPYVAPSPGREEAKKMNLLKCIVAVYFRRWRLGLNLPRFYTADALAKVCKRYASGLAKGEVLGRGSQRQE